MVVYRPATPEERQARLLAHVCRGWQVVRADAPSRARSLRWLVEHPSRWPELDRLWASALEGAGPLAAWLETGGREEDWTLALPLHSVLASHPFAPLRSWSSPAK